MQELYASQLKALCARLGVTESVHFLGYVPDDDLIALYGEASVLVHPALSEGFGLALLQAMAAGVPVVAAASDGPRVDTLGGERLSSATRRPQGAC